MMCVHRGLDSFSQVTLRSRVRCWHLIRPRYFSIISLCTKLANPWHSFLRIVFLPLKSKTFTITLPAYQNLGLGLDEMSRFEWQKHKILENLCQGFASFVHKLKSLHTSSLLWQAFIKSQTGQRSTLQKTSMRKTRVQVTLSRASQCRTSPASQRHRVLQALLCSTLLVSFQAGLVLVMCFTTAALLCPVRYTQAW